MMYQLNKRSCTGRLHDPMQDKHRSSRVDLQSNDIVRRIHSKATLCSSRLRKHRHGPPSALLAVTGLWAADEGRPR